MSLSLLSLLMPDPLSGVELFAGMRVVLDDPQAVKMARTDTTSICDAIRFNIIMQRYSIIFGLL